MIIFDIGFNVGDFSRVCFEKYPDCTVVAVEANKDLYFSNTIDNPNLHLINKLVSDKDGEMKDFFVELNQTGISTASKDFMEKSRFRMGSKYLPPGSGRWIYAGKVSTVTLDTLVKDHGAPDILKVDVEGYEYEVLLGLNEKTGKICFECHEEEKDKLDKILKHLVDIGYTEFGLIGYFEEGDVFENLTFSDQGDPYLVEPLKYRKHQEFKKDISSCFTPERRINYGMVWCR